MSNPYLSTTGTPTPGPWKSLKEDDLGFQVDVVSADNARKHIAAAPFDGRFMKDGESVANARLIAAAPDLYAALERIIEGFEADGNPAAGLTSQHILDAHYALAKADGRTVASS